MKRQASYWVRQLKKDFIYYGMFTNKDKQLKKNSSVLILKGVLTQIRLGLPTKGPGILAVPQLSVRHSRDIIRPSEIWPLIQVHKETFACRVQYRTKNELQPNI